MVKILQGDCRELLKSIPDGSIQCVCTSPPYWGLRAYLPQDHPDKAKEIGQEKSPEEYIETMVGVFREVKRCLHESGVVFLNVGDSYVSSGGHTKSGENGLLAGMADDVQSSRNIKSKPVPVNLPVKNLCMIPWRLALALQADGWLIRSVICWHKKSCMPESVTDRPTNSWEPIFLLAKSQKYFYDAEAVKEPSVTDIGSSKIRFGGTKYGDSNDPKFATKSGNVYEDSGSRNQRNVWSLGPEPFKESHFAVFPTEIPRRAILAGTSEKGCCPKCYSPWVRNTEPDIPKFKPCTPIIRKEVELTPEDSALVEWLESGNGDYRISVVGDKHHNNWSEQTTPNGREMHYERKGYSLFHWGWKTKTVGWKPGCDCGIEPQQCTVLDPFGGSGTVAQVALELNRKVILCELNADYVNIERDRIQKEVSAPRLALEFA